MWAGSIGAVLGSLLEAYAGEDSEDYAGKTCPRRGSLVEAHSRYRVLILPSSTAPAGDVYEKR